jgi:hypothetical protein
VKLDHNANYEKNVEIYWFENVCIWFVFKFPCTCMYVYEE